MNAFLSEIEPIIRRVWEAKAFTAALILLSGFAVLSGQRFFKGRFSPKTSARVGTVVLTAVILLGLAHVWSFAWLGDDAFISFRYSQNFAEGHGLVFNIGEWVEGYTNFLWTFILGVLNFLGLSIPHTALLLNLLSFLGVLIVVHKIVVWRSDTQLLLPSWSTILLAGCTPFAIYGTSGLETMAGVLCVVLGLHASLRGAYLRAGVFFVLGAMMRPDHILFWGCMGLALAVDDLMSRNGPLLGRLDWGRYVRFTLPLLLIFLPFFAFRWWLYGDMFPNTYYAKSGGLTYFSQGFRYLGVFLGTTGGILWVPLLLVGVFAGPRRRGGLILRTFTGLSVLIFGTYVCKVGGGFMENRFLLVLLPLVFLTIENWTRESWVESGSPRALIAMVLLATAVITRVEVVKPFQKKWHIAAEHTWYQVGKLFPLEIKSRYFGIGQKLGKMFAEHEYKPTIAYPCVGMVGYYSRLPIVDTYGLVNRRVAHKPLKKRGRPGHEKRASFEDAKAEGAELAHDLYASSHLKKFLEVRMAGTSLYLMQPQQELRKKLQGVSGIRWPQNVSTAIRQAINSSDRTRLLEFNELGERIVSETNRLLIKEALSTIDDFEDGVAEWTIKGQQPIRNAANLLNRSGRFALELSAGKAVEMSRKVSLEAGQFVTGLVAEGGAEGQRIELQQDGKVVSVASSNGEPFFRSFRLTANETGRYELVIKSDGGDRPLLVDAFHVAKSNSGVAKAKREFDYRQWMSDLRWGGAPIEKETVGAVASIINRWSFDDGKFPMNTKVTGTAFGKAPVFKGLGRQMKLGGQAFGGFVNSYHGGDDPTGQIDFPAFVVSGAHIHVSIAGGANCEKVYLALVVEGKVRHRFCGKNDEIFRPRRIATQRYLGKTASLRLVDKAKGAWGHIMLDEVVFEASPTSKD